MANNLLKITYFSWVFLLSLFPENKMRQVEKFREKSLCTIRTGFFFFVFRHNAKTFATIIFLKRNTVQCRKKKRRQRKKKKGSGGAASERSRVCSRPPQRPPRAWTKLLSLEDGGYGASAPSRSRRAHPNCVIDALKCAQ